jgi:hypothetical protein
VGTGAAFARAVSGTCACAAVPLSPLRRAPPSLLHLCCAIRAASISSSTCAAARRSPPRPAKTACGSQSTNDLHATLAHAGGVCHEHQAWGYDFTSVPIHSNVARAIYLHEAVPRPGVQRHQLGGRDPLPLLLLGGILPLRRVALAQHPGEIVAECGGIAVSWAAR